MAGMNATRLRSTAATGEDPDWDNAAAATSDGWTLVLDAPTLTAFEANRQPVISQPHAVRFGADFPDVLAGDRMTFDHPVAAVAAMVWDVDGDPIPQLLPDGQAGAFIVKLRKVSG